MDEDPYAALLERYERRQVTGEGTVDYQNPTVQSLVSELDATAERHLDSMIEEPDDRLFPEHPLGEGHEETDSPWIDLRASYKKLVPLARAYVTPPSAYHADSTVLEAIQHGFKFLSEYYNADTEQYGNWWAWEIGIPVRLLQSLLIVQEDLPDALVEHQTDVLESFTYRPRIDQGVGDLLTMADIRTKIGLVQGEEDIIVEALETVPQAFKYRGKGGFFPDGSSIFHPGVGGFPYNMRYGAAFLTDGTSLIALLNGSPWSLEREEYGGNMNFLYEVAFGGFEPLIWRGQGMSMVNGRFQLGDNEAQTGEWVTNTFIRLGALDDGQLGRRCQRIAKHWIETNTYRDFLGGRSSLPAYGRTARLLENDDIEPRGPLTMTKQYYNMDRAVYRNGDAAFGLALLSSRIANFEAFGPRGPRRGWFTSYGMTYCYTDDLAQYNGGFWHTVDPRHIPGTTANPGIRDQISRHTPGTNPHAGGVEFDDQAATSGMVLTSVVDPNLLTAHKSWFYFGDVLVAVGSGIRGDGEDEPLVTTVENRNLGTEDTGTLTIDGEVAAQSAPTDTGAQSISWAHLDRETEAIGYCFPTAPEMRVVRESNTSSDPGTGTRDATGPVASRKTESERPFTNHFVKLLLEHGARPEGEAYTYAISPGASAEETAAMADDPPFVVRERSESAHVVEYTERSVFGIQTFTEASLTDPGIEVDGPASIMYREADEEFEIGIADPTQQRDSITVDLPQTVSEVVEVDDAVSVLNRDPLRLRVSTGDLSKFKRGSTLMARFER